ncbi:sigma factor-like helix-turn-helix DNA-binding protein [Catellatospora sp. NPDC049111]|jgi:RNA polymerase sigma-70 factor (ECF subfamily)|uniref:sigma factor-like helix-turn-helix DNA-binding protein n=1 Tax=unclassified Catellatospora TaxID=2645785 RepID=UPI0033D57433
MIELPLAAAQARQADSAVDPATEWALAARTGDPVAQAAFVRSTQAEVWRFVAALVDPGSADDLTQETYLRAFRALPAFEGRSTVRTWLLGIARRTCADHLRTVVRQRRLGVRLAAQVLVSGPHPDPAGQVGAAQLLDRLSPERREAFVLTQLLGLSYEQAAAVQEVPVGTIRSRVARARAELVDDVVSALAA